MSASGWLPPPHLHGEARHGNRIARAPVAGAGDADAIRTVLLDDVDRALRRDLRLRIERQPGPEAVLEDRLDRVLLGVIDSTRSGSSSRIAPQHVDRDPRALVLVLEVRRVDQDQLAVRGGQLDLLGVGRDLVAGDAVQADLADAEDRRAIEERRACRCSTSRDSSRSSDSFGFIAEPGVVLDAGTAPRGAARTR